MILVLFYLAALCLIVILLRKRYKYEGVVFLYLREPLVTEWCLLFFVAAGFFYFISILPFLKYNFILVLLSFIISPGREVLLLSTAFIIGACLFCSSCFVDADI